jgi:peptidoglycan/xylan/chitin deacetylase (PgdA/CDA1 family)
MNTLDQVLCLSVAIAVLAVPLRGSPALAADPALAVPAIAKWYGNRAAAVSLRFDDSLDSHVTYVIPKLNEYGIKATFMINPGLDRYQRHREFWENDVPRMGHQLGNHTMHHRGAATPAEAEFEIGEVSRLIWRLYPHASKLLVFASGGGRGDTWGGKPWKEASPEYKAIARKYHLIDLFDGTHPYLSARSNLTGDDIIGAVRKAVQANGHQAIGFHGVGDSRSMMDYLKTLYRGADLTLGREAFEESLAFLREMQDVVWTGPLGDVLKYQAERDAARLTVLSATAAGLRLSLTVGTDRELYDHPVTVVVPGVKAKDVASIAQDGRLIERHGERNGLVFDVEPVSGTIDIVLRGG